MHRAHQVHFHNQPEVAALQRTASALPEAKVTGVDDNGCAMTDLPFSGAA